MPDIRPLLERVMERVELRPFTLEGFHDRRDRKRRNQRIAAGVVGIAVFLAAVWIVTSAGSFDRMATPADKPRMSPAEDVATNFLYAADADQAVSYLADGADLSGLGVEGLRQFRLWIALNEAMGFEAIATSCEEWGNSPSLAYVRCTYDFYGLRSQEIGRGPYSGNYIDITVSDGHIVRAALYSDFGKFSRQMWDPFAEWVTTNYPEDAAVMYDENRTDWFNAHLSPRSIRLWERHTREYVETRSAETAPALASAAPEVVKQGPCSGDARSRLELTDIGDRISARFEVHRSPVGDAWRIVLRHSHTGPGPVLEVTRAASDSGDLAAQKSVPDQPDVDRFEAEARDRRTGQFCMVVAVI